MTLEQFLINLLVSKRGFPCRVLEKKLPVWECLTLIPCVRSQMKKRGYTDKEIAELMPLALAEQVPEKFEKLRSYLPTIGDLAERPIPDYPEETV